VSISRIECVWAECIYRGTSQQAVIRISPSRLCVSFKAEGTSVYRENRMRAGRMHIEALTNML
jgi:hypothetical protein